MARENNFLLGSGERLTKTVTVPSGGGDKNAPYSFADARSRVSERLSVAQAQLASVPEEACPRGEVVAVVTLHPRYVAKSDFPTDLLGAVGLRAVGSKSRVITPENWGVRKHPEGAVATTDLFVAGAKSAFQSWSSSLPRWTPQASGANQLTRIEDIAAFQAQDKIRSIPEDRDEAWLEAVIHNGHDSSIVAAFDSYARSVGAEPLMDRRRDAGGLTFIPVRFSTAHVEQLAAFSFLRVVRGMPALRPLQPGIIRQVGGFQVAMPEGDALDSSLKVAVFDGGLPSGDNSVARWVQQIDPAGIGNPVPGYQEHGLAVTSALLFGPLSPNVVPSRPYAVIEHIRVLDERSGTDAADLEILDVLDRILTVLDNNPGRYQYANISLGPELATTDDEVTAWTASLDERLAREDFLVTVAVGNNGHLDHAAGLSRVQPPGDGVNVLSVGASTSAGSSWQRASYSCIGPGRCPGIVKPDGVAFGGSPAEPFYTLAPATGTTVGYQGTSFAAPYVLRSAVGVRTHLGDRLTPLAVRALHIHRAHDAGHSRTEVGWGRFETDVESLVTCEDDEALVLFQGKLPISEHLRAYVPVPDDGLVGMVTIAATLLVAPETDPEHPATYTRSGLEVAFRPHDANYRHYPDGRVSSHPQTRPFFSQANMHGAGEYALRGEGHKWEPCLRYTKRLRATSLSRPCFDIYYHSREAAVAASEPQPIPYALVIGIKARRVLDLYNRIVRTYANVLVPLRPVIQIPVRTTG